VVTVYFIIRKMTVRKVHRWPKVVWINWAKLDDYEHIKTTSDRNGEPGCGMSAV